MTKRKRIGRPPKPAKERKTVNFTFRSRGDMRQKLQDAAAPYGRSISEEIERRLEQSFRDEYIAEVAAAAAIRMYEEREVAKVLSEKPPSEEGSK